MKLILVFVLCSWGLYGILTASFPHVYPPAVKMLRRRSPKKITQTEMLVQKFTGFLANRIELDSLRRMTLAEELQSLGHSISPEHFYAQALTKGLIYGGAALFIGVLFLPPVLALALAMVSIWLGFKHHVDKLQKKLQERREQIERELPQFASTIHQALHNTHNIIAILESYRKVCGGALKGEIDRTLNEMKTGNPERALKSFESRIASAELSQLTRGLVGVLRGDDRRMYFETLAMSYQKAAREAVSKELLLRPQKLYPYFAMLFGCLVLIVGIALGLTIIQQMHSFF